MHRVIPVLLLAVLCTAASPAREAYHWFPARADSKPRPWALLFPRAMGVGSLQSGNQYVEYARFLNARGIDALVVDDDQAAKMVPARGSTGEKLAILAQDAVNDARSQGRMDERCPGVAIGWSRGGEGALTLASKGSLVKAAIVFYASVRGQPKPWVQKLPVLAFQGTNDSLAPHANLEKLAAGRSPQTLPFEIILYPGAKHRFDVKTPTAKPNPAGPVEKDFVSSASADALLRADAFLAKQGISGQSCALD